MSALHGKTTLSLLVAAALVSACDKDEPKAASMEKKEDDAPASNVKVELPASPNFDEGKAPETWEDGSFSVWGLRSKLDERVKEGETNKEILVKGWIQEIYEPPVCPEGETCPPPKQSHVWIVDNETEQGKKRAMMVVNYKFQIPEYQAKMWKDQPMIVLEKGQRYSFKGKFKQFSDTGFADDRGLLEFISYKPHDPETKAELDQWVFPPGAPWHPVAIAETEKQNAELVEKAKETSVKQP
jgi:hypothetical protein